MFRFERILADVDYWWNNGTSAAARGVRRAYDVLPGSGVGFDSHGDDGPSISYAGVADGRSHVLAPAEMWRQGERAGAPRVRRSGGRLLRPHRWAAAPERADLLLVGAYAGQVGGLGLGACLVAPLRVHYRVPLPDAPEDCLARFGRKDRENIRRALKRHDWRLEIGERESDFEFFYDRMHVPTMAARHHGWVRSERRAVALHPLFRRGRLFFLRRDGERVAGVLCRVHEDTLNVRLAGVLDGDSRHYRDGAQLLLYHLLLEWAAGQRIPYAEMSGSRPFISEGLFSFKRKFRPEIVLPGTHFRDKRLLIVPRRDTPAVRSFLRDHPVITADPGGRLGVVYPYDAGRPPRTDLPGDCAGLRGPVELDLDRMLAGLPGASAHREATAVT
ncbi:GNAT family N-acetyltransferase [Actinoplanes oblitus]|uniref:GNAT family N-acetyltransferase n=1 Tax=Actinoplanes oblitus TaxID=3040509 RepID=A0ABY8WAY4_9ACTN|nr:GNAT family N-acetyltransferase [Actinoplanes oblitus]WIM94532.1 GNAT family N-acetyltransferase [Actinoplanes oblitus]